MAGPGVPPEEHVDLPGKKEKQRREAFLFMFLTHTGKKKKEHLYTLRTQHVCAGMVTHSHEDSRVIH